MQDSTVEEVTDRGIKEGDIVYLTYTLLDSSKKNIPGYENIEEDLCIGDLEFDELVETELLGEKKGCALNYLQINGEKFTGKEGKVYINLKVTRIEERIYAICKRSCSNYKI